MGRKYPRNRPYRDPTRTTVWGRHPNPPYINGERTCARDRKGSAMITNLVIIPELHFICIGAKGFSLQCSYSVIPHGQIPQQFRRILTLAISFKRNFGFGSPGDDIRRKNVPIKSFKKPDGTPGRNPTPVKIRPNALIGEIQDIVVNIMLFRNKMGNKTKSQAIPSSAYYFLALGGFRFNVLKHLYTMSLLQRSGRGYVLYLNPIALAIGGMVIRNTLKKSVCSMLRKRTHTSIKWFPPPAMGIEEKLNILCNSPDGSHCVDLQQLNTHRCYKMENPYVKKQLGPKNGIPTSHP